MDHFTTPKGTVLPMAKIKGKNYLLVCHRIVWFREDHPDWRIKTTVTYDLKERWSLGHATIFDAQGNEMATAHKFEDFKGFPDYIEKSETSAIGRALALCGYGTQFAPDLYEDNRLVDAPIEPSEHYDQTVPEPKPNVVTPKTKLFDSWTNQQMKEYAIAKYNVPSSELGPVQRAEVLALSQCKPFRVAMSDLGEKK